MVRAGQDRTGFVPCLLPRSVSQPPLPWISYYRVKGRPTPLPPLLPLAQKSLDPEAAAAWRQEQHERLMLEAAEAGR